MSMIRCDDCERDIDTDFDVEAIIDTSPTTTASLCRWCREKADSPLPVSPRRQPVRDGGVTP